MRVGGFGRWAWSHSGKVASRVEEVYHLVDKQGRVEEDGIAHLHHWHIGWNDFG